MVTWIKKKIIKYAIGDVKAKLALLEIKEPGLLEFRKNLYTLSIPEFMEYAMETLAKDDLNKYTYITYVKKLLTPLDDKVEDNIDFILDEFKP